MKGEDTRVKRVNARLTEKEHEELLERYESSGEQNQSDYFRRCIFSDELSKSNALINELHDTNYQIRKIGVLINQIAHKVNSGYGYSKGNEQIILEKFNEIEMMFLKLKNQIGGGR